MALKEAFCKTKSLLSYVQFAHGNVPLLIHSGTSPYKAEVRLSTSLSAFTPYTDYWGLNRYLSSEHPNTVYVHCGNGSFRDRSVLSDLVKLHLLNFKKLVPTDHNCEVVNWAMLTVKSAFRNCRHYLDEAQSPFLLLTHHGNLEYIKVAKR